MYNNKFVLAQMDGNITTLSHVNIFVCLKSIKKKYAENIETIIFFNYIDHQSCIPYKIVSILNISILPF